MLPQLAKKKEKNQTRSSIAKRVCVLIKARRYIWWFIRKRDISLLRLREYAEKTIRLRLRRVYVAPVLDQPVVLVVVCAITSDEHGVV